MLNVNALTLFITLHFILELPWMDEPWRYVIYDAVMLIFAAITLVSQVRPCFCVWKVLRQILMVESNDLPRQARDMQKRTIERKGAPTAFVFVLVSISQCVVPMACCAIGLFLTGWRIGTVLGDSNFAYVVRARLPAYLPTPRCVCSQSVQMDPK